MNGEAVREAAKQVSGDERNVDCAFEEILLI